MRRLETLLFISVLALSIQPFSLCLAEETPPGDLFTRFEGRWQLSYEVYSQPGETPETGGGIETHRPLDDGSWSIVDFRGKLFGQPYVSHSVNTYSAETDTYRHYFFDASARQAQPSESRYDAERDVFVRSWEGPDFAGKPSTWRQVLRFPTADRYELELTTRDAEGKERRAIRCVGKRLKG